MSAQPRALDLADELDVGDFDVLTNYEAADELRRLHEVNTALLKACTHLAEGIEACGIPGVFLNQAHAAIAKATGEES